MGLLIFGWVPTISYSFKKFTYLFCARVFTFKPLTYFMFFDLGMVLVFQQLLIQRAWDHHQISLLISTPQNGQKHSNNLSAKADELLECV